ncbi:esterase-like activity of phytase family protein [Desulfosarcina ovata]|uniref:Alkaline phosphatase n=1 Tax=Desulfosarcina ovata subsp. ovata TaxID=2752305 RepID=A0A5K8AA42_9BACT|nr:esterase-like activity of phytase family protein [Desulfosarcina ovata]BBO89381.1 alkaline phosphatase [Desulfosarcina ovata subsp. ovata]
MKKLGIAAVGLILVLILSPLSAFSKGPKHNPIRTPTALFQHVGTFDVMAGNGSAVAEIVDVTVNGKQLVYTDSENGAIGFVDISDPAHPVAQGTVAVGGEPTSLVVLDPLVLVGVNTSESYASPSGELVVVHRNNRKIVAVYELGGQPDSLALAPDRKRAAIVIENERDEDFDDGLIPQLPSGTLLIVDLRGPAKKWKITAADLSPVMESAFAGSDLEAEFVDINNRNQAVVSFQENNHLAIIDLVTGRTVNHFSAGSVELKNVDTKENDLIEFDTPITKRAEPDAVAWIDDDSFATANEGDYEDAEGEEGGSRGFTVFNVDGSVEYESAESFEHWLASMGHYNEGRSENKGCEPESAEMGVYGNGRHGRTLLFVGSERCNAVGVYDVSHGFPEPLQVLPTGIGPEGLKAIPKRNLFVASTETDVADAGIPTMINIYRLGQATAAYPMIASDDDDNGTPIPWVALSGLAGDPEDADTLYAVSDSFLAEGFIYTIDVSSQPAKIVSRLQVTGASESLDLEGIAVDPDGNFWLGSEGNAGSRPNLVLKVNALTGAVISEIQLPAGLEENARKNGIEGIAVTGETESEVVYVAIQRAWPDAGDTDTVNTKIGRYDVATGEWGFLHYPLEAEGNGGWIGLSELALLPDGTFAVIERDKGWGPTTGLNAELKAIYGVDLAAAEFRAFDDTEGLVTIDKTLLRDLLPEMAVASIWTAEKLEGLAVAADGQVYSVTDNDGLDDAPGETLFLRHGDWF